MYSPVFGTVLAIHALGTLTNDAYNMLERNERTYFWSHLNDGEEFSFHADGDIHVADGEVEVIKCQDEAHMCWFLDVYGFTHPDSPRASW